MSTPLHPDIDRVLISSAQIQERIVELAAQIDRDYADERPLLLVGVLKGAFIFLADLARALTIPHAVDFMAVSSYGDEVTSSGAVRILKDLNENIEGRHVLIVEDIATTGGQVLEAAQQIVQLGAEVVAIVAVIDRLEGARENIESAGFRFESLMTTSDLGIKSN